MRRIWIGLCCILCMITRCPWSVCAADIQIGVHGGTLVLSVAEDPKTFNPIVAQDATSAFFHGFMFEGLTTLDPVTGEVLPALAQQWKTNFDGTEWNIQLRADVYWADGKPFTADDVVYTYNALIYNPKVLTSLSSVLSVNGKPFHCKKTGVYSVQFTLDAPFAPFLKALNVPILPRHLVEPLVTTNTFNEAWTISDFPDSIIGTGPFQLSRYIPGEQVILTRNKYYWKRDPYGRQLPYLDTIRVLMIPSEDMALLRFKNGELDMYTVRGIDVPWLKPFMKEGRFNLFDQGPTMASSFIVCNQNKGTNLESQKPYVVSYKQEWFCARQFRQALAYALNKKDLIDILFNGLAVPQHSAMSPAAGFFYNPFVYEYAYSVEKAHRLLAEIGMIDRDNDGIREDYAGNRIAFSILCNANSAHGLQLANMVRKDFAALGCDVSLEPVDFNTMVNRLTYSYDWEVALIGLTGGSEPHFGANVWLSSGPLHMWNPRQTTPETEWEARIDALFAEGVRTIHEDERKKLYDEWQVIVSEHVPLIYTVIPRQFVGVQKRIQNVRPTPLGGVLHNSEELFIMQEESKERAQ